MTTREWRNNVKNCRKGLNMTNADMYIIESKVNGIDSFFNADGVFSVDKSNINDITDNVIDSLLSPEGIRKDNDTYYTLTFGDFRNRFTFSEEFVLDDYTTITYAGGGILKIISYTTREGKPAFNKLHFAADGSDDDWNGRLNVETVWDVIKDTSGYAYPSKWKHAMGAIAEKAYTKTQYVSSKKPAYKKIVTQAKNICTNDTVKAYINSMYNSLSYAVPAAMAARYYEQIFKNLKNNCGGGLKVTDYSNEDNCVLFMALPVMDFTGLELVFENSFSAIGNLLSTGFSYKYCVVDLLQADSYADKPGLVAGQFPMKFTSGIKVNNDNTYKTTKLVLQRVDSISGTNFDTFTMGRRATDYERITNPLRIKYKDDESIVSGSVDDNTEVILGNGGSYQKKKIDRTVKQEKDTFIPGDLYCVRGADSTKMKYNRTKHFFIDPFALTVAQWCYIMCTDANIRGAYAVAKRTAI